METIKDRLTTFYKAIGITKREFERRCGLSNGYMDKLKDCPSSIKLERIISEFPHLNRVWLVTGEGDMLNDGTVMNGDNSVMAANINGNNEQNGGKVIEVLSAQLSEKDRQIDRLLGIIERLS